jgi:L-2-hydroxyglutarate oxidase
MSKRNSCTIIGGGIVGLATAYAIQQLQPDVQITVLEKEPQIAKHQTGRNSGVIHSGIYYKPGSLKARLAKAGNESMVRFCEQHQIAHKICGKIIVATEQEQLKNLANIYSRGLANGLAIEKKNLGELRELEPEVSAIEGIFVPSAGIVDYVAVCHKLVDLVEKAGGRILTGQEVKKIEDCGQSVRITTNSTILESSISIACAGLHSDRLARRSKVDPNLRIIPFKGEYFELVPQKRSLVRSLIYPVPNPDYPFLGVHLHRMIDGSVQAGPNAVLSLKREGYGKLDLNLQDTFDIVSFGGFWRFARANFKEGAKEFIRSLSKELFLKSLQQLVPNIEKQDLMVSTTGVRAQALDLNGGLIDDFRIVKSGRMVHVCNAPSPAATAALEIGNFIGQQVNEYFPQTKTSANG